MKCPKCGYHSFDYLDSCKKCSAALADHKSKFNLRSLIFPNVEAAPSRDLPVPDLAGSEEEALAQVQESALESGSDFGYDFMEDEAPQPQTTQALAATASPEPAPEAPDDAFSWDDDTLNPSDTASEPTAPESTVAAATEFDDLIAEESSPLGDTFDWDEEEEPGGIATPEPQTEEEAGGDLGLDLSWDTDLPALEEEDTVTDFEADDDLPDWDFDDEPLPEEKKAKKPTGEESPQDPFDSRGSGFDQAPSIAETDRAEKAAVPEETTTSPAPVAPTPAEPGPVVPATPESAQQEIVSPPVDELPILETADAMVPEPQKPSGGITPPAVGLRLAASVIDLAILAATCTLFLVAGQAALFPESEYLLPTPDALLALAPPYFLILFAVFFGYFTLFHFLAGQSPGKMLTGLRVESREGEPLSFTQAFLRSAGGLFSILPAALGFFAILTNSERRGWNDQLACTRVVRADHGPEPEELEGGPLEVKQQAL